MSKNQYFIFVEMKSLGHSVQTMNLNLCAKRCFPFPSHRRPAGVDEAVDRKPGAEQFPPPSC